MQPATMQPKRKKDETDDIDRNRPNHLRDMWGKAKRNEEFAKMVIFPFFLHFSEKHRYQVTINFDLCTKTK